MFRAFLAGQGAAAAVACVMILTVTKLVKVSVPFFYQYVLDTLGTGAMTAPAWLSAWIAGMVAGQVGPTAGVLVALYVVTKCVAQALQSGNDVMFSYAMQPCVRKAGRDTVLQLFDMPLSFHAQSNTGALTRSMERGIRAVTAVLSRIVLHLLPQAFELIIVAVIIGMRGGIDMAVVAVATVAAYAGFTIATVNTRTKVLQS